MEDAMENSNEQVGGQSSGAAGTTSGQTQSGAGQGLKDQAIAQAHALVDQARTTAQDKVRSAVTTGKTSTVQALSGIAESLSVAGQQLRDQQNGASRFVDQAADRLDKAAKYIDTAEVDDLIQRTESWARSNPALFLGGAFVLGVLGARFLKSSRPAPAWQGSSSSRATFSDREVQTSPVVGDV
jgi:hypothetical protein